MDFQSGGRSLPGVQISIGSGRSNQDVTELTHKIDLLTKSFEHLQQAADASTRTVTETLTKQVAASTKAGEPAQRQARATRAPFSQSDAEYEQAVQQRRRRQRQQIVQRENDPQEQQFRDIMARQRSKQMEETIKRGGQGGLLSKGLNALSWAPGVPPALYQALLAGGETGLGLSATALAGLVGVGAFGAAGIGLSSMLTQQQTTGEHLAATIGAAPGFVSGAQDTALLQKKEYDFSLRSGQGQEIAAGLAAGGLSRKDALGTALDQTAALVNVFGLSIKDSTDLVTRSMKDFGYTTQQVTDLEANLALVAQATGAPLSALGQMVQNVPGLQQNLGPNGDVGLVANMFRQVYGTGQQATDMATVANARGAGAFDLAALLQTTVTDLASMRNSPQGQQQIIDRLNARARDLNKTMGFDAGYMAFNQYIAPSGVQVSPQAFQEAIATKPDAGATALADQSYMLMDARDQALSHPTGAPGSEDQALADLIAGQPGAAAQHAKPPSVAKTGRYDLGQIGTTIGTMFTLDPTRTVSPQAQTAAATMIGGPGAGILSDAVRLAGFVQDQGGIGNAASAEVRHVLNATFTLVNQAGGILGIKQINIPLPNGDQSTQQYVPAPTGTPRPR